ncbi:hypothetical protein KFL_000580410 [Klebsormidium nitens]|uniref:HNH domain-containing protein n=1 Tax=Klebsormidium nitens TaxID=105231 RepID=A0A1Y1HVT7_KLENI|nr:hypothetical protein KFL_000580410 [Klebsormidium nitens]|eukprot:GAQ80647.1 hypothetical protein KFL_000580410 [Klebsormidium nitens]
MALKTSLELVLDKVRGDGTGGLRLGGSKNRVAARDEVREPLPAGASVRGVEWRSIFGEPQKSSQGLDEDGNPLCKMCQKICRGRFAKFPKKMADLFCTLTCADQYSTRTSSAHNRRRLFELERGVCSMCNLDCHKMVTTLKGLSDAQRRKSIFEMAPAFLDYPKKLDYLLANFNEGNAWHADHIVAVYEGGGECDLENLRTLCVPCHAKVTSEQTKRRASEARLAKNDDPKQRKLSFVPRVKKKRPAEFVDLGSDEVRTRGYGVSCTAVFLSGANAFATSLKGLEDHDWLRLSSFLWDLRDLARPRDALSRLLRSSIRNDRKESLDASALTTGSIHPFQPLSMLEFSNDCSAGSVSARKRPRLAS